MLNRIAKKQVKSILTVSLVVRYYSEKDTYLTMLSSYNMDLKKMHSQSQSKVERTIFDRMIRKKNINGLVDLMFTIRRLRLF